MYVLVHVVMCVLCVLLVPHVCTAPSSVSSDSSAGHYTDYYYDSTEYTADYTSESIYGNKTLLLDDESISVERSNTMKIVFVSTGLVGCPGNVIVIAVILMSRRMRGKPFNIFILHQSLVDLFVCLSLVVGQFYHDISDLPQGTSYTVKDVYCRIWVVLSMLWVFVLASTYNLVALSIERYQAITRPLHYDEKKVKKRLPYIFIAIWVWAFIVMSPDFVLSGIMEDGTCQLLVFAEHDRAVVIFTFWLLAILIVPTTIMMYVYIRMIIVIQKDSLSSKAPETENKKESLKEKPSKEKGSKKGDFHASVKRVNTMKKVHSNIVQTCMIVTLFFIISYSYSLTIDGLIVYEVYSDFTGNIWNAGVIMMMLNSCINPFIYTIRYTEFKQELKRLLFCQSVRSRMSSLKDSSVASIS